MLRGISFVNTPPIVSIPRESGVTSRRRMSCLTSLFKIPPWIAAPIETASSGFTERLPSFPKIVFTTSWTFGIREEPPTNNTSSILSAVRPASESAFLQGSFVLSYNSSVICSNWARVKVFWRCFGPVASAVIYGRLISVVVWFESAIFAFSAASRKRCIAIGSLPRSIPVSFLNSAMSQSEITRSQSSPPSFVSPFVERTSNTPSANWRIEISNVPPPRS